MKLMEYVFSAVIDGTQCHIRSYHSDVQRQEVVADRPHKHYFMEFHCVFEGEETISLPLEEREIRLTAGQILLMPRESYHGVNTDNGTVSRLCFNFSCEAEEETPLLALYRKIREVMIFEDPEAIGFASQCRELRLKDPEPFHEQRQGLLLLSVVLRLFGNLSGARVLPVRRDSHALRQKWIIEEYIERHFTESTGLSGLAEALFLSQRQTRKLVRQFLGEDYKSVIIRRRMELAEIYLRDPEKSLEDIAWLVGYHSYSGFQLCFKKYFGMTPSEKREKES